MASQKMENNLSILCPSNTGHKSIGTKAISTINLFKQLNCALELKLSNF